MSDYFYEIGKPVVCLAGVQGWITLGGEDPGRRDPGPEQGGVYTVFDISTRDIYYHGTGCQRTTILRLEGFPCWYVAIELSNPPQVNFRPCKTDITELRRILECPVPSTTQPETIST